MVTLGQKVECRITGFSGIAVARTEWLNGCSRIMVQPRVDKDGKLPSVEQIDEASLHILDLKSP